MFNLKFKRTNNVNFSVIPFFGFLWEDFLSQLFLSEWFCSAATNNNKRPQDEVCSPLISSISVFPNTRTPAWFLWEVRFYFIVTYLGYFLITFVLFLVSFSVPSGVNGYDCKVYLFLSFFFRFLIKNVNKKINVLAIYL